MNSKKLLLTALAILASGATIGALVIGNQFSQQQTANYQPNEQINQIGNQLPFLTKASYLANIEQNIELQITGTNSQTSQKKVTSYQVHANLQIQPLGQLQQLSYAGAYFSVQESLFDGQSAAELREVFSTPVIVGFDEQGKLSALYTQRQLSPSDYNRFYSFFSTVQLIEPDTNLTSTWHAEEDRDMGLVSVNYSAQGSRVTKSVAQVLTTQFAIPGIEANPTNSRAEYRFDAHQLAELTALDMYAFYREGELVSKLKNHIHLVKEVNDHYAKDTPWYTGKVDLPKMLNAYFDKPGVQVTSSYRQYKRNSQESTISINELLQEMKTKLAQGGDREMVGSYMSILTGVLSQNPEEALALYELFGDEAVPDWQKGATLAVLGDNQSEPAQRLLTQVFLDEDLDNYARLHALASSISIQTPSYELLGGLEMMVERSLIETDFDDSTSELYETALLTYAGVGAELKESDSYKETIRLKLRSLAKEHPNMSQDYIVTAMGNSRDPKLIKDITLFLNSDDTALKRAAIAAIGQYPEELSFDYLKSVIEQNPNTYEAQLAAKELSRYDSEAVQTFLQGIDTEKT
ncbi:HEAT repeat domain-containing protein [Pseudoalteromonas luteoviolacea]|uniref:Vitellogenin domain-containing protein n=1 Tax=Pseudoalteromonas luteoviolacea S4060-1 TaxID=1365257 RepID=A0A167LR26_9GAMM|nr:HEAT repeat domain-containing protein [Pseudoalteromonas luteoviolacea]KZN65048.1 hypothetical protein N478_03300 [Pseudoalteromonas luteoviolacea S4060-1]